MSKTSSFAADLSDPRLLGRTLPEGFYRRAKKHPEHSLYFKKVNGKWEPTNYGKALDFVLRTMAGLKALGFSRGQKICIFSENRFEWMLTDYAAQWLGGATTAIYSTSTEEQIQYLLDHSETTVLFVSDAHHLSRIQALHGLKTVKHIVLWDSIPNPIIPNGLQLMKAEDFLKTAMSEREAEALLPQINEEDMCLLLYTSGTTGEPKGVMHNHRNMMSDLTAILKAVPGIEENKITLSFLPLSHIYERTIHNIWIQIGVHVYFAESLDKLIENVQEVRPQIMCAVPRIFEKMYAKIQEKVKNAPPLRKELFYAAMAVGKKAFKYLYHGKKLPLHLAATYKLFDLLVFKKIRAITGGRAEFFVSGGAPLSPEIAEFFYYAGFTILEGYGLSESCLLSCNMPGRLKIGTVGPAFAGVEFKIDPDGEICVRGPMIMMGYYKKPEETAAVIDTAGWFHTGDIGEIDTDGFVKITDRKKDLIITAGGKNIAPQPIENSLKADPLIEAVCLIGDKKKFVVALIVPNVELCRTWGQVKGEKIESINDCGSNAALRDHFQREVDKVNLELPKYSTIKDFRVLSVPFTIDTGELTPTLKLKRRVIQERYHDLIQTMYPD